MADLNELSEIEKQLKNLIEERQSHDRIWREGGIVKVDSEHDSVYDQNKNRRKIEDAAEQMMGEVKTFMMVEEHGKPFTRDYMKNYRPGMFMGVPEHGRPFDNRTELSRMAVHEHGRPFAGRTDMKIREHGQPFDQSPRRFATKMMSEFHGKPYERKSERKVTPDDAPFSLSSMTSWLPSFGSSSTTEEPKTPRNKIVGISTNMAVREHGQPYSKNSLNCASKEASDELQ